MNRIVFIVGVLLLRPALADEPPEKWKQEPVQSVVPEKSVTTEKSAAFPNPFSIGEDPLNEELDQTTRRLLQATSCQAKVETLLQARQIRALERIATNLEKISATLEKISRKKTP